MQKKRHFTPDFKRHVVEEFLSGISTPAQISRKHQISGGLLYYWKKLYALGRLGNEPRYELALKERVKELECMVGKLTMDNELLKKALQRILETSLKKEHSLLLTVPDAGEPSLGGAK